MTRVLFHLGMPKTGTTLLQTTMARAADSLRGQGVLYPRTGRVGAAHHPLAMVLRDRGPAERAAFLSDLATEIEVARNEAPGVRVALVSSEGMVHVCVESADWFADFLAAPGRGLRGAAVIFLREVTAFFESDYFQTTRFRSLDLTFEQYLAPHWTWLHGLLSGLKVIRGRMGDALEVALAGPGYHVLRAFETRLGLPGGFLDEAADGVPPTARPSLKSQIALTHLDWVEAQVGFRIARRAFARILSSETVFAGDVPRFTVYAPGQRAEVAAEGIRIIEAAGFHDYAALTRALPPETLPHHVIDRGMLTPHDIAAVAALRDRIDAASENSQVDRAARRAARQAARRQP